MPAHRITSPAFSVTIDGTKYPLRLDFTAMADFERVTGRSVLDLVGQVVGMIQGLPQIDPSQPPETGASTEFLGNLLKDLDLSATDIQALAWACMGGEDSALTLREAGRMIHAGNMVSVIQSLAATVSGAMPEPSLQPEDEQSHPPPSETTGPVGSNSGASDDMTSSSASPTSGD